MTRTFDRELELAASEKHSEAWTDHIHVCEDFISVTIKLLTGGGMSAKIAR